MRVQRPLRASGTPRPRRTGSAVAAVAAAGIAFVAAACSSQTPAQKANGLLAKGIAAQRAGDLSSATGYYNQVLAIQPNNYYALYDLGDVEETQNQNANAEYHYRAALAVNPNYAPALYNLAILETASAPVSAENLYQQVLAVQPNNAAAHLNLGFLQIKLGQVAEGRKNVAIADKLEPSFKSIALPTPNSITASGAPAPTTTVPPATPTGAKPTPAKAGKPVTPTTVAKANAAPAASATTTT